MGRKEDRSIYEKQVGKKGEIRRENGDERKEEGGDSGQRYADNKIIEVCSSLCRLY